MAAREVALPTHYLYSHRSMAAIPCDLKCALQLQTECSNTMCDIWVISPYKPHAHLLSFGNQASCNCVLIFGEPLRHRDHQFS